MIVPRLLLLILCRPGLVGVESKVELDSLERSDETRVNVLDPKDSCLRSWPGI